MCLRVARARPCIDPLQAGGSVHSSRHCPMLTNALSLFRISVVIDYMVGKLIGEVRATQRTSNDTSTTRRINNSQRTSGGATRGGRMDITSAISQCEYAATSRNTIAIAQRHLPKCEHAMLRRISITIIRLRSAMRARNSTTIVIHGCKRIRSRVLGSRASTRLDGGGVPPQDEHGSVGR